MKKELSINSKEVKMVYNSIVNTVRNYQEDKYYKAECNSDRFRYEYEWSYLTGNSELEFLCRAKKYDIDINQFWEKVMELDTTKYNIIENYRFGHLQNCYYEIIFNDIIGDLDLETKK